MDIMDKREKIPLPSIPIHNHKLIPDIIQQNEMIRQQK